MQTITELTTLTMKTEKFTTSSLAASIFGFLNLKSAARIAVSILSLIVLIFMTAETNRAQQFCNAASISIPTSGAANPYPSNITVSGLTGSVGSVTVTLNNIQHAYGSDVDILLVSPTGQKFIILSDVGGSNGFNTAATITLSDVAAASLPTSTAAIASGTYKPTNSGTGDTFPASAPIAPYESPAPAGSATFASVFGGTTPNGVWKLYVVDDESGDSGSVSGGWCLNVTTVAPAPGQLQFGSNSYAFDEKNLNAVITVSRTAGSFGAVTVDYASVGGTATGGAACTADVDYINAPGTLSFADGEIGEKNFIVQLCRDSVIEPSETVNLQLSNPTGGASLGTPSATTLTIQNSPNSILGQSAMLTASDGALADHFGRSVAISGDTAIVGVEGDDTDGATNHGSAYIFVRNGAVWTLQQKLTAADRATDDFFGISVAIAGDTVIVGASGDNNGTVSDQGSAYIFARSGTVWMLQQKLTAADGTAGDRFGISVAIAGDTAIVGAESDDIGANTDQGSAYIFARNGTVWTEQQKLAASDGATDDFFGGNVAIAGDTAVVGASLNDIGANTDQGSAYVFVRSGTTWTLQQKLTALDGALDDNFGVSVAMAGEMVIVGANCGDICTNNKGSAYIFVRSGTTWTQQQKLTASDGAADDNFGFSVAIAGEKAIVGANLDDNGANTNQGSAYIFIRSGTVWTEQAQLLATDGAAGDNFGYSVAIAGDTAIVGAVFDDIEANTNQGSAYIFSAAPPTAASVTVAGRVLTANGRAISRARVTLTDASGVTRTALSNPFGYYRFEDVRAGETYIFNAYSKRYSFAPQAVTVKEDLTDLNFTAEP